MKRIIFSFFLIISFQSLFAEYAVVDNIVYSVSVGNLTASVVNFQTSINNPTSISIPNHIVYKSEVYEVTSLLYNGFDYDAVKDYYDGYKAAVAVFGIETVSALSAFDDGPDMERERRERKFKFNYEEARANIVELCLSSSITYIGSDAFKGMNRLKNLRIPSSVKDFSMSCFDGNVRLESITFEGIPHLCYSFKTGEMLDFPWTVYRDTICLDESSYPLAVLDSLQLNEKFKEECPKLKTIEFLPLKEYVLYNNKLDQTYQVYARQLRDTINKYAKRLTAHPYYIEDEHFKGIFLTKPILATTKAKESYTTQVSALKKDYKKQLTLCREKYKNLWDNMEQNCKQKSLETYADRYCALHHEFSARLDSMLEDYKCRHTKQSLASLILQNIELGKTCQDSLWEKYAYLYKRKEDFLLAYTLSPDINIELARRNSIFNNLRRTIYTQDLKTKGIYNGDSWPAIDFKMKYDLMTKNEIPVSVLIIEKDPKALKEFEKNGQYFDSPDEFFAAYIRSNYSNILKSKKKSKNK